MGDRTQIADWRVRAAARLGGALVCAGLFALLMAASRSLLPPERAAVGVEMILAEHAPPAQQRVHPPLSSPTAPSAHAPPAAPSIEAEMLSRMLRCIRRPGQPRPADCPGEPAQPDWARPQIPVGGDYAQPEQPDFDRIYTRAEQRTLVMPSCRRDGAGACIPFGARPPPPSRSAEQICRDGGLGGPCAPPPESVASTP